MKKVLSVLVILSILSFCIFTYADTVTSWTATKASFKVLVHGQEYISETPPLVVEGRTYLPLRAMGTVLGVSVDWNAKLNQAEVGMSAVSKDASANTQTALSAAEKAVWQKASWKATKASFKVMVLGKELVSENPPIVVEGRTFLPLRVLGTALGVKVDWNDTLKQAEVDMGGKVPEPTKPATPVVTPTPTSTPTPTESHNHNHNPQPTPTDSDTPIPTGLEDIDLPAFAETPANTTAPATTPAPTTPAPADTPASANTPSPATT